MRGRSGAGRLRTPALAVAVLLALAIAACAPAPVEQRIAGPVRIGSAWTELTAPAPLRVVESQQEVFVGRDGVADWDVATSSIVLSDGSRVRIEAWLVDERGEEYELTLSGIGGRGGFYLTRKSAVFPSDGLRAPTPLFPPDRTYLRVRVRSDRELDVREVAWVCHSNT